LQLRLCLLFIYYRLKRNFREKNHGVEEDLVNCGDFNSINQAKQGNFQGILKNYPEPELEPEPQFGFSAPQSRVGAARNNFHDTDDS
jgi:hypothetical protein